MTKYYPNGPIRCQKCMYKLFNQPEHHSPDSPRSKYCQDCLQELYPYPCSLWVSDLTEYMKFFWVDQSNEEE